MKKQFRIWWISKYAAFLHIAGKPFNGWYSFDGIGFIIFSSFLTGFLGTILLYQALKYLRFSIANVTRAFSPVLLAVVSFPFFPIVVTWQNSLGAVILIGSILLLTVKPRVREREQAK